MKSFSNANDPFNLLNQIKAATDLPTVLNNGKQLLAVSAHSFPYVEQAIAHAASNFQDLSSARLRLVEDFAKSARFSEHILALQLLVKYQVVPFALYEAHVNAKILSVPAKPIHSQFIAENILLHFLQDVAVLKRDLNKPDHVFTQQQLTLERTVQNLTVGIESAGATRIVRALQNLEVTPGNFLQLAELRKLKLQSVMHLLESKMLTAVNYWLQLGDIDLTAITKKAPIKNQDAWFTSLVFRLITDEVVRRSYLQRITSYSSGYDDNTIKWAEAEMASLGIQPDSLPPVPSRNGKSSS